MEKAGQKGERNRRGAPAGEFGQILLLALGFGMVGLDRFMISTLFPVIARDLSLDYSDIGTITGALAIAWGASALFMGNLADRIGQRVVLTGAMVLFSLLIGFSGLAGGLAGLVIVRILMGLADGAYTPASITATLEASPARRKGRNLGLQQMTALLFGLGIAPLLIPPLLHLIDWRLVFVLLAPPGLLLAWLTWRYVPDHVPSADEHHGGSFSAWRAVASHRNVRIGMALMLAWLTCLVTVSAFMPSYLMDHLHMSFAQMGLAMSAIGLGGTVGTVALPWLSDHFGRKPIMIGGTAGALAGVVALSLVGPTTTHVFAGLFLTMGCIMALITLTVGPLCSESVPVGLAATASGVVIAIGEFFGGGVAPILAGQVAQRFGIDHVLWLPMGALTVALGLCLVIAPPRHNLTFNRTADDPAA